MDYLVDTNIIIEHSKKIPGALLLLKELKEKDRLYCSVISITEYGAGLKHQVEKEIKCLKDIYLPIDINAQIAELAGRLINQYRKKYLGFDIADAIIAATAISDKLNLVTRNRRHFPMKEIKLYKIK